MKLSRVVNVWCIVKAADGGLPGAMYCVATGGGVLMRMEAAGGGFPGSPELVADGGSIDVHVAIKEGSQGGSIYRLGPTGCAFHNICGDNSLLGQV